MHVEDVSMFIHAQNLLLFTKFKGLDPEAESPTALPPLRVITGGLKIKL